MRPWGGSRAASSSACGSRRRSSANRSCCSSTSRSSRSTSATSTSSSTCSTRHRRRTGTPVLFVTHDINPVHHAVDRVLYLAGGTWAIGAVDEVLTSETLSPALRHRRRRAAGTRPHRRRRDARRTPPPTLMFVELLHQHFVHTALFAGAVVAVVSGRDRPLRRRARALVRRARDLRARLHRRDGCARARPRSGARDLRRLAARRRHARRPLAARQRARQLDRRRARVRPRPRRALPLALPGVRDGGDEPALREHRRRRRQPAARPRRRSPSSCSSAWRLSTARCSSRASIPRWRRRAACPCALLSVAMFLLLALATAEAIQVVGVLLVLTLVITPAAAAQRLTARPGLALAPQRRDRASSSTEGGILLSLVQPWPTTFFISTISFAVYVAARVYGSRTTTPSSSA